MVGNVRKIMMISLRWTASFLEDSLDIVWHFLVCYLQTAWIATEYHDPEIKLNEVLR